MTVRSILTFVHVSRRSCSVTLTANVLLNAFDPNKTDILVKHILELFNSTGLTAQQAKDVLTHLQVLVEIGERVAHGKTTH